MAMPLLEEQDLELEKLLSTHGKSLADLPTAGWGEGSAKSVADLLHELRTGQSRLAVDAGGRVCRELAVVKVCFPTLRPLLVSFGHLLATQALIAQDLRPLLARRCASPAPGRRSTLSKSSRSAVATCDSATSC